MFFPLNLFTDPLHSFVAPETPDHRHYRHNTVFIMSMPLTVWYKIAVSVSIAMTSARVTTVSECKPVFHRRAERNTQPTDKADPSQELRETDEHTETDDGTKPFVFTKTHEEFCFNFNL